MNSNQHRYIEAKKLYDVHGKQEEEPTEPSGSGQYIYPSVHHKPRMQKLSDAIAQASQ